MKRAIQRWKRTSHGGVLVETAVVTLLLMLLVVGMGSVAVQIQAVQARGKIAQEAAAYAALHLEETGGIDEDALERIAQMGADRFGGAGEDVHIVLSHVRRSDETGIYDLAQSWETGGHAASGTLEVRNPPGAPGIHAGGVSITLEPGEEVLAAEAIVRDTGTPKGTRAPFDRRLWAVIPIR